MQLLNTKINVAVPKFLIKVGNYNKGHESMRKQHTLGCLEASQ